MPVPHAIMQLEKELGVPLFEKNGRRTVLTRFGEEFLKRNSDLDVKFTFHTGVTA